LPRPPCPPKAPDNRRPLQRRHTSSGDHLQTDSLLTAQPLLTGAPDAMLFIVPHQPSEFWMRPALHELNAAPHSIAADRVREAFRRLARSSRLWHLRTTLWRYTTP